VAEVVERYIELALRLGRHADELIDSYYGPPEISARVEAEAPRDPRELAEDAAALLAEVRDDGWVTGQLRSLEASARKLAGEELPYAEEVELVYGLAPRWHPEASFERAAELLDEALPGEGDVAARLARWYAETAVPGELLEQALQDMAAELRRLTRDSIGLPEGEAFELELVTGKRWLGYARYLGNLRTHISINVELPLPAADLLLLTSHEIYGGHHTHRVWQEVELVRGRGELERTLDVLWSPEAVISEGIAMVGPDLVAGGDGQALTSEVLGRLGFAYDAEVGSRVTAARRLLAPVSANVAMLIHDRGASREEAEEYARAWTLQPQERLERLVRSQLEAPSPGYQHSYWQGRELVERHVRGEAGRFRDLLTARLLPRDLA
jgi:hypothetical protein